MAVHLRFKRHLRFLRDGPAVRVVSNLEDAAALPAGESFDHLLAALTHTPQEDELKVDLSRRMRVDTSLVDALLARLFELRLLERFDPEEHTIQRFDRQHVMLDALDPGTDHATTIQRQQRLADAHVLVLGMGGIGHQVALSLAAAGVGALTLVDDDVVEVSNLHRQILFAAGDIGRSKVSAAAMACCASLQCAGSARWRSPSAVQSSGNGPSALSGRCAT